jgi:CubicO group peptidase (beta-lactamase class C family)
VNVAVVEAGEIVHVEGDPDERLQAGSVSKAIAALTALRLVAVGALDLDSDVNERLESWRLPDGEGVTLRRLLGHTAGLGVPFFPGYADGEPLPALVQVLDGEPPANTSPVRVEQPPGAGFAYSGGGYAVVQQLVEDATGLPFADAAADLVLDPLGMRDSTFFQSRGGPYRYPEAAAAGLWSTASDLTRFAIAVQRGAEGTEAMVAPHVELPAEGEWTVLRSLGLEPPDRMGLGLFLSATGWFSHLGGAQGAFSGVFGSLAGGHGVAAMTRGGATPAFFERLLAIATERGWDGFAARVPEA